VQGDAFHLEESHPLVTVFQESYQAIARRPLAFGGKPFLDDGNVFFSRAGLPALTHGPNAKGAHTIHESVTVDELVRVAQTYALTAVGYCGEQ
jgi:acetylornithine deacetylase/succinyl-diaminopimelate desuccinylase-like protein